ncbi:MAG: 4-hydroxy-tetrahydrodipicolinate synthase [Candidatus Buchananbacteria bacterium]|nr:4-hydroxy-tetrahydrodipicolinate synthase [Candidatus Buchananbacteria bacterium]
MEKPQSRLVGVTTALVTPFTENGEIDWERLQRNLEFQISQGVAGVLPCGTTGESPTLTWEEHYRLIRRVISWTKGRVFVLAGTGSNNTAEALKASIEAAEDGADGVLLVEPYYNKPASAQLRQHYHQPIARAVYHANPKCLVVPYIIPGRTCCKLEPLDLAILAQECPNVRAVKEATGDLENMRRTRFLVQNEIGILEHFKIFSGDDAITADMMIADGIAGDGVISVMSNIIPNPIDRMVKAILRRNCALGRQLNQQLNPLFGKVGVSSAGPRTNHDPQSHVTDKWPNPCAIKTMMRILGLDTGTMRPPLGPVDDSAEAACRQALDEVHHNAPETFSRLEAFYGINVRQQLG